MENEQILQKFQIFFFHCHFLPYRVYFLQEPPFSPNMPGGGRELFYVDQSRLSSAFLLFRRLASPHGIHDPKGMELGLTRMCFTEHMDFEFPVSDATPAGFFEVNLDSYLYDLLTYREKYRDRIRLLFGLELGLQAHLVPLQAACAASKPFDFIIGSSHLCAGKDPFQPYFWEGRSTEEALREYFSSIIENLETFTDFDVYGHLDYAVRYAPGQDKDYCYEKYADLFERILDLLLENGIGLEINTGGLGYGLRDVNPARAILRRYREKGGEIITIGSDAHRPQDLCRFFGRAEEILKDCGFRYYTVFEGRTPHFEKLD